MARIAAEGFPDPGRMTAFLADHELDEGQRTPLCVHPLPGENFGTTSASAIVVGPEGRLAGYWFAHGPPCRAPLKDVTPDLSSPWTSPPWNPQGNE
jgi:hypothetical protein